MPIYKVDMTELPVEQTTIRERHPKCEGYHDYYGEFDCGYGSILFCEECKYGLGRKDPEAKCNHI